MLIVLFFDITFLAEFISISTLIGYCLIMSIIIYKKMSRKHISLIIMGVLFLLSLFFGIFHQMGVRQGIIALVLSAIITTIVIIVVE